MKLKVNRIFKFNLGLVNLRLEYTSVTLLLTCVLLTYSLSTPALDLNPLKSPKSNVNIALTEKDNSLKKILELELIEQRKLNRQLKYYKTPAKIAQYEKQLLNKRLRAEGYYGAKIRSRGTESGSFHTVTQGPLYRIKDIHWQLLVKEQNYFTNAIPINSPLKAQEILDLQKQITRHIESNHCFYKVVVDYDITVFHEDHSADIVWLQQPSEQTTFGAITFEGLTRIEPQYLAKRIDLKTGNCFKPSAINQARLSLYQTNLIASVEATDSGPTSNGVDTTFFVKERKHRSLQLGGGFRSEEGLGVSAGWRHRNLWGKAEQANIELYLSSPRQTLAGELVLPHFKQNNQNLSFYADLTEEDTDAFKSRVLSGGTLLSRKLTHKIRAEVGLQLDFSQVEEDQDTEEFALPSIPISLEYDSRNAPLDSRKGWVGSVAAQPFWNLYEQDTRFLKTNIAASYYHTFKKLWGTPTLAVRAASGSISGATRDSIPANERFYVGGGGSVRGYPFQTLGPLTNGEPDGGLSFSEYSIEGRFHWGQNWGSVLFLDGGAAYRERVPSVEEKLFWGAGIGARYYTSFAPIRFDLAFPLDKRRGIDDSFQIYISIGQAF